LIAAGATALALITSACTLDATQRAEGPAEILLAPYTHLKLARTLIFLPPAEGLKLMQTLGERPGAEVLGVVLTHDEATPRMLIIFAKSRDARGVPAVELVGWDEAPAARSFIEELLLARQKSGSGTDFH
jgi:uncharacterized membrane-anchored protein